MDVLSALALRRPLLRTHRGRGDVRRSALAIGAPDASASLLDACPDAEASQPFLPRGDQSMYMLAPVGGAGDSQGLALPGGSDATTASTCIGLDSPTLRFFVRNDGDPDAGLRVSVIVHTLLGPLTLPIGTVDGTDSWHPTPPLLLLANLTALPIVNDGTARVELRFRPVGSGGDWRIDDVYVDPWKGR
jgi:hypothetical protein